ncbi:MAG: cytochrome C oxidase subunit IV family protein [bacterium]
MTQTRVINAVGLLLIVFTALTYWYSQHESSNLTLLLLALVKCSFIAAFFMDLRRHPWILAAMTAALLCITAFLVVLLPGS